jgi:hypothetical protein
VRGIPRIVLIIVIVGSAVVATAAALAATTLIGQHATGQHPTGQHWTVLPKASCGSATTHFVNSDTQVLIADHEALTCFGAAARACRSASIEVTEMGVDTGTNYVFIVEGGGSACQVTELTQDYSANFGGSTGPVNAMTCARTAVTGRGVTLACGGQAVLIPSAVSSRPLAGN